MKRAMILAAGLLLPLAVSAGVSVQVNVGLEDDQEYYQGSGGSESECDDVWFEPMSSEGPFEISREYQWHFSRGEWVLRHRVVRYHTFRANWIFGPWQIKAGYCRPGYALRRGYTYYYRPAHRTVVWRVVRTPDRGYRYDRPVYRYEYRYEGPRAKKRVYHYESRTDYSPARLSRGSHRSEARPTVRRYDAPQEHNRPAIRPVPDSRPSRVAPQGAVSPAPNSTGMGKTRVRETVSVTHIGGAGTVRQHNNTSITKVSSRERVR